MTLSDIETYKALLSVASAKNISKEIVASILEEAIMVAYDRILGYKNIKVRCDHDLHRIFIYRNWRVVDKVLDSEQEILAAQDLQIEDGYYQEPLSLDGASRSLTHQVSTLIMRRFNMLKNEHLEQELKQPYKLISGKVIEADQEGVKINLTKYDVVASLSKNHTLSYDRFMIGDNVKAVVIDVESIGGRLKISVSRSHQNMIIALSRFIVPEINEGILDIVSIARKPSIRCKIALTSHTLSKDKIIPYFMGFRGQRMQEMKKYIGDEKIDLSIWDSNHHVAIKNSLQGVDIVKIEDIDEQNSVIHVRDQKDIPKIIGVNGVNIFLTGQLVSRKLYIKS